MTLIEDKGNQKGKHILKHEWWKENNIGLERYPLPVGDYIVLTDKVREMIERKKKRGVEIKKMDFVGTYDICVDTKNSIEELMTNIIGSQHARFRDELLFAQNNDIKLYIVVENFGGRIQGTDVKNPVIHRLEELSRWKNPRLFIMQKTDEIIGQYKNGRPIYRKVQKYPKATKGVTLMKACYTMQEKYGCEFLFCKPEDSAELVLNLIRCGRHDRR